MGFRGSRSAGAAAVVLGLLAGWLAGGDPPEARQPREHHVYVSVVDADGNPVTGLDADDFAVREDGLAREVLRVGRATEPMDIVVLVDNSEAATPAIADLREGLRRFVDALEQGNQLSLITFGERPTILVDSSTTPAQLRASINRLFPRPGTGSYMLEAVVEASRDLARREAVRPVMVVIATEGPEFSNDYYVSVLKALHESEATLHALILSSGGMAAHGDEARSRDAVLWDGPATTGGRRELLLTEMAIPATLDQLASEMKQQYRLVYSRPDSLIPPETLAITVRRAGLTARATTIPDER